MQEWYFPMEEQDILEDIELYRPGGFHPIMPFDFLGDDNRFEVWTKLGQGTFGLVWLCHDNQQDKFCAVKILRSDTSSQQGVLSELRVRDMPQGVSGGDSWDNHVAVPNEHFWQNGPNGKHFCLVMPVLGPAISRTYWYNSHDTALLKNICFQLVEGMAFLHSHGVCHGDFRPANILFKTTLDNLTVDEMDAYMPNPRAHEICRRDGSEENPHAPKYAIEPMILDLEDRYITKDIAITDFGVAFEVSKPPKHASIPEACAAPENQPKIDAPPGIGSDLWALGITILETLCGTNPFRAVRVFAAEDGAFSWSTVEEALGPVPEPYRPKLIEQKHHEIEDSSVALTDPLLNSPQALEMNRAERQERYGTEDFLYGLASRKTENLHPDWNDTTNKIEPKARKGWDTSGTMVRDAAQSIEELDMSALSYTQDNNDRSAIISKDDRAESSIVSSKHITELPPRQPIYITRQLDPAAVPGVVDLLKRLLRWLPEDRVPAEQLLEHPWFEGRNKKRKRFSCSSRVPESVTINATTSEQDVVVDMGNPSNTSVAEQKYVSGDQESDEAIPPQEEDTDAKPIEKIVKDTPHEKLLK